MRLSRSWLVLLYVLATVVVQGSHDHGRGDEGGTSQHEAGCSDPRPHIAGHWSPDLSNDHDHCLACQFRAEHQGWILTPFGLDRPVGSLLTDSAGPSTSITTFRWNTCRAPPERETAA
ncbi:hypothetical protein [Singulisphaera acidiphila]|uniref:hypothetical protein n=1 Tax=Singulisphaera acidiphila TaxID=466153 RepID=UPI0012FA2C15|nr:hypothetical protein [Singulisphaera acidiphila]